MIDRTVPLADLLRTCIVLGGRTGSARLSDWATSELRGYRDRNPIPVYRIVSVPIVVRTEYYDTSLTGIPTTPSKLKDILENHDYSLFLTQPLDELDALAVQSEVSGKQISFAVNNETWKVYNDRRRSSLPGSSYIITDMQWSFKAPVIRGVLGQIRTALAAFVSELRTEVGDDVPSAIQTDEALRVAVPGTFFANSNVTIMTTGRGDIVADGDKTNIRDNKTTIKGSAGNFSVASSRVTQSSGATLNGERIKDFADLILQISPTLHLAPELAAELREVADDLAHIAGSPVPEVGRLRRLIESALRLLRSAAPNVAGKLAISMGDEFVREIGEGIIHELPH